MDGSVIKLHYSSRVLDGQELDTSRGRSPVTLELGATEVIPGWAEGLRGMKSGGKRTLNIPPSLWNGAKGMAESIPKDAVLQFDMELLEAHRPTLVEKIGQRRLVLGGLIVLIGLWELVPQ